MTRSYDMLKLCTTGKKIQGFQLFFFSSDFSWFMIMYGLIKEIICLQTSHTFNLDIFYYKTKDKHIFYPWKTFISKWTLLKSSQLDYKVTLSYVTIFSFFLFLSPTFKSDRLFSLRQWEKTYCRSSSSVEYNFCGLMERNYVLWSVSRIM